MCWLNNILTFLTCTSSSFRGASLSYLVRPSRAIRRSSGTLRYSLDSCTGFGCTPCGGRIPAFLRPPFISARRLLGARLCGHEYISHTPQELQKEASIYGFRSLKSLFDAALINIGCPRLCLGHKSVQVLHWQQIDAARFKSMEEVRCFFATIRWSFGRTKIAFVVFVTGSEPFPIRPIIGPPTK